MMHRAGQIATAILANLSANVNKYLTRACPHRIQDFAWQALPVCLKIACNLLLAELVAIPLISDIPSKIMPQIICFKISHDRVELLGPKMMLC